MKFENTKQHKIKNATEPNSSHIQKFTLKKKPKFNCRKLRVEGSHITEQGKLHLETIKLPKIKQEPQVKHKPRNQNSVKTTPITPIKIKTLEKKDEDLDIQRKKENEKRKGTFFFQPEGAGSSRDTTSFVSSIELVIFSSLLFSSLPTNQFSKNFKFQTYTQKLGNTQKQNGTN